VGEKSSRGTLWHFLEGECDREERELVRDFLLPTAAALALSLPQVKPFVGVAQCHPSKPETRQLHPHLVRSLVSHILLSTSPKSSMNLGLQQLPCDPIACWRLRCLLCYLHSLLQLTAPSHLLTFTKEVLTREGEEEVSRWQDSDLPLIPLLLVEEEDGTSAQQLRLLCSPALSSTSPVHIAFPRFGGCQVG